MFKEYLKSLLNLLFPLSCFSCGRKITKGHLCLTCYEKINFLKPPLCLYCSRPLGSIAKDICKECLSKTYPYHQVISTTIYQPPIVELIHLFKYRHYDYLGKFFASLMIQQLLKLGFKTREYHYLTYIPMHQHKLRIRGYNHSQVLAKLLANYFKIPLKGDIIKAVQYRPSQTKLLKKQRQKNVEGIFAAREGLQNKNILLVDDILTSGATIKSCCQALKQKGAAIITVVTLSKTL